MAKLRESTGGAYERRGSFYMRITVGPQKRESVRLPWVTSEQWSTHVAGPTCPCVACGRARTIQAMVHRLRQANETSWIEKYLEIGATADEEKLAGMARTLEGIVAGKIVKATPASSGGPLTFRTFAERWTGGELHRDFPDHVRSKRTADDDEFRLEKHIYPVIGDRALASLTLDDALEVMRRLPSELAPASRRHVAQLMTRIFSLAVYPCRVLASSPLPRGFLPKKKNQKAKSALFPDEEARLLGAPADVVPLASRVLYGFLSREGMRSSEAMRMTWSDLDLDRGVVRLDKNKTDDPRAWALDVGTAEALRRWKTIAAPADDEATVFAAVKDYGHLACELRDHLRAAGVTRAELFARSAARLPLRVHDLRSTFVTVSLAAGKSEAWVTARTGHRSSGQVAGYRRIAQTFADVNATGFVDMASAIPELRDAAANAAAASADGPRRSSKPSRKAGKQLRTSAGAAPSEALGSAG